MVYSFLCSFCVILSKSEIWLSSKNIHDKVFLIMGAGFADE